MSSHAGHVTTETVFGQTLALQLGDGDEHCALELDTTGLNVKGNLYVTYSLILIFPVLPAHPPQIFRNIFVKVKMRFLQEL